MRPQRGRRLVGTGWRLAIAGILATTLVFGACEHPLSVVTPHIEAADLWVSEREGEVIARTELNRSWSVDSLVIRDGEPMALVLTPMDFRGEPIDIADRDDLSFRMEAEDGALIQWEPLTGYGWLRPFARGETRIRFLIWHIGHADFVTPWLRVVVESPP